MQLEVSETHVQVTVSAANMRGGSFYCNYADGSLCCNYQVIFSAVHYAHDCFHRYYAGDSDVGDSF